MTKWLPLLLACWLPCPTLSAQPVFHKKIDSLYAAYGLAPMPDGGYLVSGLRDNCVQILRLDADADVLWAQQVCPVNAKNDLSIGALQVLPDGAAGGFFLMFRKGGFSSAPDNLLNLMRFDADGNPLWQSQLRPTLRYGSFSSGNALAATPSGTVWAVHGLGYTPALPYFNQILLFKVQPSGTVELRNYYQNTEPATANGVLVRGDDEIFLYGGLGYSVGDGFLLKINSSGTVLWAKRYANFSFIRDGGRFQNGDFLLYGTTPVGMAFARIQPDGAVAWVKKIASGFNPNLFKVAADNGIFALVSRPKTPADSIAPAALLKLAPDATAVDWANTYETCTDYLVSELQPTADGGLAFLQNADDGPPYARFLKVDAEGQLRPGCPAQPMPLPALESLSIVVADAAFSLQSSNIAANEGLFQVMPTEAYLSDHCPAQLPEAHFSLPDSVCAGTALRLAADGNSQSHTWQWLLPGSSAPTEQSAVVENIVYVSEGLFPVKLVQQYGICADTFADTLRVLPPLVADLFTFSDTVLCPGSPFRAAPLAADFDAWLWDDGSEHPTRIFEQPRTGTYRLRAQRGVCTVTDSFALRVSGCGTSGIYAPNVFSPNGDGQQEQWEISVQPDFVLLRCGVYDRWGNLLYTSGPGEAPRWDGFFKGKNAPPGVYAWVLHFRNAEGREETQRGDLTLLR